MEMQSKSISEHEHKTKWSVWKDCKFEMFQTVETFDLSHQISSNKLSYGPNFVEKWKYIKTFIFVFVLFYNDNLFIITSYFVEAYIVFAKELLV